MKPIKLILFLFFAIYSSNAQESVDYQKPPKEILDLVDVSPAPSVRVDKKGENLIFLYRDNYKTIAELSEKEMRLAGLRINPKTNISSRVNYFNKIKLKKTDDKSANQIIGLPENTRIANFSWSPDQSKVAFTNTTSKGVELWILDISERKANKITEDNLNANMGMPYRWSRDNSSLLVKFIPSDKKTLINPLDAVPTGPTITISEGTKAQNRTYQDLLKNPNDEYNFEQLAISEIKKVTLDGTITNWAPPAMYNGFSFSPDGNFVIATAIQKPFSYLVPYRRFPQETKLYEKTGKVIKTINKVPLNEVLPKGFMSTRLGKRSMVWRRDHPATLVWAEALDKGDPKVKVEFRDEIFQLSAPFTKPAKSILKTIDRYAGIQWTNSELAIAYDYWWNTRNTRTYVFDPSKPNQKPNIIHNRNYQDKYNDPGDPVSIKNKYGYSVINVQNNNIYMIGDGYTKNGQFPFIDKFDLKSNKTSRIYQSEFTDKIENIYSAINMEKGEFLIRIESPTEYPNYYIRNINKVNDLKQITFFKNPFTSIQNIHKEVIKYKRDDGLELSGTLYLPIGYDKSKKEKMPMILWAYPVEFKNKTSASQSTSNPNEFTYPFWGSMLYWVTRGYVVLDDASFPIVGEGVEEPNDSFRKQLVANGKAAIDAVNALGYIDPNRVAVGGHSYGAFMTANLLSHSNLFAAGIARSGAYNRTLTPFGFQSEERSYWEAPEIYYKMSPFMHAEKMKTPLLLIHGEADNNSGTYPLQSERYFNALKGLGATTRLVMLPKESHGYRAKESILHLLWEQDQWLEKYVKHRKKIKTEETN
ncbi:dipeptidyl aminopeptidase/acylaminoacyl peptidase [Aquimarina sp. MAR_2010_214]|uniref:alpha/beta hydrolase family protein n=1 Tax=Aquimarina sp. MAR_2010_214 TaxID=1250026 RepID=UPI000C6FCD5A|nr:prolyl oligopeptidase family serine peptidase [Aquimarina sp. MAR_2010_214]PKV51064.1 dipeptidyl aminopeptidase/acylaminoacyl peptidase [Aquimarina sp. MAR_2010_214]